MHSSALSSPRMLWNDLCPKGTGIEMVDDSNRHMHKESCARND